MKLSLFNLSALALAQADAFFWLFVILILLVVMFIGVSWLRKWYKGQDKIENHPPFSLVDLREMLRTGQLSQEEFDRLKAQMLEAMKPKAKPEPPKDEGKGRKNYDTM